MSKLPEKFKPVIIQQVQPNEASVEIVEMLTAEQSKINEIIDYLSELQEQNKPCEHKNQKSYHNSKFDHGMTCTDCGFIISSSLG